jgi:hypothetical protein
MTATLEFYPAVRLCVLIGANPEKLSPHIEAASDRVWRLYLVADWREQLDPNPGPLLDRKAF